MDETVQSRHNQKQLYQVYYDSFCYKIHIFAILYIVLTDIPEWAANASYLKKKHCPSDESITNLKLSQGETFKLLVLFISS